MKDRQVESTPAQLRIPFLSAALHLVSMTAIVFLRYSFGYAYLRPKAVFFAFSWAFSLFSIFAWQEKTVWASNRALCIFGMAAVLLYWSHLTVSYVRELCGTGKHDNDSGTPIPFGLPFLRLQDPGPEAFLKWKMLAEPAIILVAASVLYLTGERPLSKWLVFAGVSLAIKEYLNLWFVLRQKKRQKDSFEDAAETLEVEDLNSALPHASSGRKQKLRRVRRSEE